MQEINNTSTIVLDTPQIDQNGSALTKKFKKGVARIIAKRYVCEAISSEEYVQDNGMHCPFCRSYDISSGDIEIDDVQIFQKISCFDCSKSWQDVYKLTNYITT
jgi:hypothetical protein